MAYTAKREKPKECPNYAQRISQSAHTTERCENARIGLKNCRPAPK